MDTKLTDHNIDEQYARCARRCVRVKRKMADGFWYLFVHHNDERPAQTLYTIESVDAWLETCHDADIVTVRR